MSALEVIAKKNAIPIHITSISSERFDERDLFFYKGKPEVPTVRFHLKPGLFALILPGEAHQPCMKANSGYARKMVIKIPADKLNAPKA